VAESEAVAADPAEQLKPRRGRPSGRTLAREEIDAEEIQQVRFVVSVRWLETEMTSLDVGTVFSQRYRARISWHPRGVQLDAEGQPTLVVPQNNLAWVRLR
jgi:hypothetical protein